MIDKGTENDTNYEIKDIDQELSYNYQWVKPFIEGIPPQARGGHTATKVGRFIVIFGVV